jgi:redox-sensitive bicupin YhaK (pirin superfamily)
VTPDVDVRRACDRFVTHRERLELRHSFSFGEHYDPANVSFGVLLASNEMLLPPGAGFDMHEHRDVEIVTWVVSGSLEHQDSGGSAGVIHPGMAQRLSAGRGIQHSERASSSSPAHVVQMWVAPEQPGIEPSYQLLDFSDAIGAGGFVPVASGDPRHASALTIHQPLATLYAARLTEGTSVQLPTAPYVHVFVTRGSVTMDAERRLDAGDALRLTDAQGQLLTAEGSAEILVWSMR